MIEPTATAPQAPAEVPPRPSRFWRMVLFVVSAQLVFIAAGMFLFTALGFANEATGSCGGG